MEKINIIKILEDCPKGIKLYSPLFGELKFENASHNLILCQDAYRELVSFAPDGKYISKYHQAECMLFPSKENRDWSKFQIPFKDGEVLYLKAVSGYECIFINKTVKELGEPKYYNKYATLNEDLSLVIDDFPVTLKENVEEIRLATKEEKRKLFDAIKANGYKWNNETKALEKLPKFKVGDRVHNKNYKDYIYDIYDITDKGYRAKEIDADSPIIIHFGSQEDNYELVPNKFDITTLKPFESKVLVRDNGEYLWKPAIYGLSHSKGCYVVGGVCWRQCIPYEGNEHLLSTKKDCDEFYKIW